MIASRNLGSSTFFEYDTDVASSRKPLYREPRLSRNYVLRRRIKGRNKSATSGCEKLYDSWCDACPGKLSRNASLSLSPSFYFNQLLSPFLFLSPIFSLSSFSPVLCPIRHSRSLHQAPISRHIVSSGTLSEVDQINFDRGALCSTLF